MCRYFERFIWRAFYFQEISSSSFRKACVEQVSCNGALYWLIDLFAGRRRKISFEFNVPSVFCQIRSRISDIFSWKLAFRCVCGICFHFATSMELRFVVLERDKVKVADSHLCGIALRKSHLSERCVTERSKTKSACRAHRSHSENLRTSMIQQRTAVCAVWMWIVRTERERSPTQAHRVRRRCSGAFRNDVIYSPAKKGWM